MPNAPASSADMDFSNAPGGDTLFDDLFPPEGQISSPAAAQPTTDAVATVPTTSQPDYFLKTSTGTVYKTAEDAQKGIEHKDALIEKLRNEYIAKTGVDPVTGQPIKKDEPTKPVNYLEDQTRYFNDLKTAVEKGDSNAYMQAQTKLIYDALAPVAPVITNFAKAQAVQQLSGEIKEIGTFVGSDDYKSAVGAVPMLESAINQAESDYRFAQNLPELYRMAYYVSVGKKGPIVVKEPTPNPQPRPSLQPTTLAPAEASASAESLTNSPGRKALIARMEQQGIGNVRW